MAHIRSLQAADLPNLYSLYHADDFREREALLIGTLRPLASESLDRLAKRFSELSSPSVWVGAFSDASDDAPLVAAVELAYPPFARLRHTLKLSLVALVPHTRALETMLREVVDQAFAFANIMRITVEIGAHEHAAIAMLERIDFVRELKLTDAVLENGKPCDLLGLARVLLALPEATSPTAVVRSAARTLKLADVRIRASEASDADAFGEFMSDRTILTHTFQMPFEGQQKWQRVLGSNRDSGIHSFVAEHRELGVIAGAVLMPMSDPRRAHEVHLGISIHQGAQGQGVGDKLIRALLSFADAVGYWRVSLDVNSSNNRGIALYEKLGFVSEGRQRAKTVRYGGYEDALAMARVMR